MKDQFIRNSFRYSFERSLPILLSIALEVFLLWFSSLTLFTTIQIIDPAQK
jgi:hypothetical protein